MNGFILLLPFFFIRFVVLAFLDRTSLQRAAMFAPLKGNEKTAYYIYLLTNAGVILYPFFLTVKPKLSPLFLVGLICYLLGLLLCLFTVKAFSSPDKSGLNTDGIYRFSRNPMYVSYFVCFLGIALLTSFPLTPPYIPSGNTSLLPLQTPLQRAAHPGRSIS